MTLPQNVKDAVKELDAVHDQRFAPWRGQWQTIRAHLMSQEAEIERVKSIADAHCDGRLTAIDRLAAANALLRDVSRYLDPRQYPNAIKRIDEHLQGAGDEA